MIKLSIMTFMVAGSFSLLSAADVKSKAAPVKYRTVKQQKQAETRAKLDAIRQQISKEDCRSDFSCWTGVYKRKWLSEKAPTKKELDSISDRYIELIEKMLEISPNDLSIILQYAEALFVRGRYEDAEKTYKSVIEKASAYRHPPNAQLAEAKYRLAELTFQKGDKEGTIKQLKELLDARYNTGGRRQKNWMARARCAYNFLVDATPLVLGLPVWSGAKAFPEPQEAKYTDTFVPLSSVWVKTRGIDLNDARVELLVRKLNARTIKAQTDSGEYEVSLDLNPNAQVDRKEGYTLEIGAKSAKISARDKQGILWGVVSFIQCLSNTEKSVRVCSIKDWPDTAWRGYESVPMWGNTTEYTLFSKLNYAVIQRYPIDDGDDSPLNVYQCRALAQEFRKFGLKLCFGISNHTMGLGWPYLHKGTLDMHIDRCKMLASMGAHVYYPNDDSRYPAHKDDLKTGKNPSDFDAEHVLAVFKGVKAKYPWFTMIYCPPFYWGPDSSAPYPDDRDKYLKSMRIFPEDIDIFWTGGQVKGYNKSKRQVEWFRSLTGQKPAIGQNGTGPHNLLSYITDETDWYGWHYPGFFENDIKAFLKNSAIPTECTQLSTLGDCLWNVKGYDKRRSVERAVGQLLGEKMYSILAPGAVALAAFDKYKYGSLTPDILHEDIEDLTRKYILASNCWEKALAYNPAVRQYGHFAGGVSFAAKVIKGAKNPPDFLAKYAKYIGPARELAEKETSFNKAKGEMLYLPTDMSGPLNTFYKHYSLKDHRFIKCIRARGTSFSTTSVKFECDPFPPAGDYELVICALDDEVKGANPMEIKVNDTVIYSGIPNFPEYAYGQKTFRIPFAAMKRYNKLEISNLADGNNMNGPPYFAISYILIRKTGEN
jgi:tetratricopeptide (TPR) repeat protein